MIVCQNCGREAPTKYVDFYENIGALVVRYQKSVSGHLCKECINEYFWTFTGKTFIGGWWGIISFLVTPFILLNNIIRYVFTLGMEPPLPGATSPRLTDSAFAAIAPYGNEIISRLGAKESVDDVASSVASRAGVTTGQVILYIRVLAMAAKEG